MKVIVPQVFIRLFVFEQCQCVQKVDLVLCPTCAVGSMLCPFLEDHKEDILCGPVWLASGLDLSGQAGMLSLTSPKLVKGDGSHDLLLL